jgi:sugar lactone lactonase YvrE
MKIHLATITGTCLALTSTAFAQKAIPNHAIANLVLGQSDFVTSSFSGPFSSLRMQFPSGLAIDPNTGKLFVSEADGDRVLRYGSAASLANGAPAEAVLGQSNFTDQGTGATQTNMSDPEGMHVDRFGRLWLADRANNRVLLFEAASFRATGSQADRVFGQPDFTTITAAITANKMSVPTSVWVDSGDRLWVADNGNNRVLRFDSISTKQSGSPANGVLGQVNFTSAAAGSGAAGLDRPLGVAVSPSGSLFVSCMTNNRVLRYDSAATLANGAAATRVLGQVDFTGTASGLSATALNSPGGLTITPGDDLFVVDRGNDRVLRFSKASTLLSGAAASGVIGQVGFTTLKALVVDARSMDFITSNNSSSADCHVDTSGNLWVPDTTNHRVLRFPPDTTLPLLTVTPVPPKTTTKKSIQIKGTASDFYGISKVIYRVNGGVAKNASGTTNWQFTTSLKKGPNTILINAVDAVGNLSATRTIKIKRN